jgi:hypothetical protein
MNALSKYALVIFLLIISFSACKRQSADLPSLFPAQASGWARTSEVRVFEAGELWRYVDGGADKYVAAGVHRTATADYRYHGQLEAVVDIHEFNAAEGARAIMDSEASAGSQPVAIGDAGRRFSRSLVFRRGACLVRIVAYQETEETAGAIAALGQAIEGRMR